MPTLTLHLPSLFHPSLRAGLALRAALREVLAESETTMPSPAGRKPNPWRLRLWQRQIPTPPLPGPENVASVAVLYFHRFRLRPALIEALRRFASAGGHILALHSAAASFQPHPEWAEFLGARFTGHDPVETFRVEPETQGCLTGLSPFSLRDEVYRLELAPDTRVEALANTASGRFPIAYSRPLGRGRLFYFGAGHRAESWKSPGSRRLLRHALNWLAETR